MENFNDLLSLKGVDNFMNFFSGSNVEISFSVDEEGKMNEFFLIARRKTDLHSGLGASASPNLPEGQGGDGDSMGGGNEDKEGDRGIQDPPAPKTRGVGDGTAPVGGGDEDGD